MRLSLLLLFVLVLTAAPAAAEEGAKFLLQSKLKAGDSAMVSVRLEVGGEMVVRPEVQQKKEEGREGKEQEDARLPLSVVARLRYQQRLLAWPDPAESDAAESGRVARSLRHYLDASATIKIDEEGIERQLSEQSRTLVAEVRNNHMAINGIDSTLTRDELDLIRVVGNPLVLDRLLPGRAIAEGESWRHEADTFGLLLGMDHVAACEVSSVVTGESHGQVKIRLAGTVHGTVDGAATEIQLRGAYLFHLRQKRITKFNLAMKEKRSIGEVAPGLDVVAKLTLEIAPLTAPSPQTDALAKKAADLSKPVLANLSYGSPQTGYRFKHDASWYVTAEQRKEVSLRRLQQGELTAHCNITSLPARSEGHGTTLQQFERDVRTSLGENLTDVVAATTWTTAAGYDCLGVIARGHVEKVPVEWRYYLLAEPGKPRVSMAVTIEQTQVERFADADRGLVDSLELLAVRVADAGLGDEQAR